MNDRSRDPGPSGRPRPPGIPGPTGVPGPPDPAVAPYPRELADARIRALLDLAPAGRDREIAAAILESSTRLAWDDVTRLDLKIVNAALRELRRSFRVFAPYRGVPKVSIFGSARTAPDHPLYALTRSTATELVARGMMVITGAGAGVMAAANEGAGPERGFGLAIRLPFEPEPNAWVHPDRLVNFKYFFTRKLIFIKESAGFVLCPGGFGTNDEAFELLTLLQTGKTEPRPVVLLDLEDGTYWETWLDFVRRELVEPGYIDEDDLRLLRTAHRPQDAVAEIERFHRLYHSSRYVGSDLMLRLRRPLAPAERAMLSERFGDIVEPPGLQPADLPPEDREDPGLASLAGVTFRFGRRRFSRLRELIDGINAL